MDYCNYLNFFTKFVIRSCVVPHAKFLTGVLIREKKVIFIGSLPTPHKTLTGHTKEKRNRKKVCFFNSSRQLRCYDYFFTRCIAFQYSSILFQPSSADWTDPGSHRRDEYFENLPSPPYPPCFREIEWVSEIFKLIKELIDHRIILCRFGHLQIYYWSATL